MMELSQNYSMKHLFIRASRMGTNIVLCACVVVGMFLIRHA